MTRRGWMAGVVLVSAAAATATAPAAAPSTRATTPATTRATTRPGELPAKSEVDRFVSPLIDGQWCEGIVVGVINEKGSKVYGYGRLSQKDPRPPAADTVF